MAHPSVDTLLERLAVCHAEISGITTAVKAPPETPLHEGALPYVYTVCNGMASAAPQRATGAGEVALDWRFTVTALIVPIQPSIEDETIGSYGYNACLPYLERFALYYVAHPRLDTVAGNGTNELNLHSDVAFQVGAPAQIPGPGNALYFGIRTTLTISVRALATRLS